MTVKVRSSEIVPFLRYFRFCNNMLRIIILCNIRAILTYWVSRLYDSSFCIIVNWLKAEESLCEQGILETDVLTLRKKFFVSDQNVHCNDPVHLNLLYVQLRDAIINGLLPCTRDESVHLAALQCQIVYGNHDKRRQKLDLHKFLPEQYTKQKGIEKLIYEAYQKLFIVREIEAKLKYIQFCQSLRTYGVTFFHVKVLIIIIHVLLL